MLINLPDWQTSFAAALSALMFALVAVNQIFIIVSNTRRRLYLNRKESKRRRKSEAASYVNRMIPPPSSDEGNLVKIGNKLGDWIAPLHEKAKLAQDRYYKALTRSISSMMVGFVILAADQTIYANSAWFGLFTNWADMLAVGITFYAFMQANRYNRQWVISRLQTELMRQRSILIYLNFKDATAAKERWEQEAIYIQRILEGCRQDEAFETAIKTLFNQFTNELMKLDIEPRIFLSFVKFYLHTRVISQLRWFGAAAESALVAEKSREKLLRNLFFVCVLMAVVRLISMHLFPVTLVSSSLSFCLVLIFGLSVCLTIDEIGRNQKVLSRQYILMYHRIEEWLENFVSQYGDFIQGKQSTVHVENDLIFFERIMIDELCNWLYISRGERLALAP